MFPALDNNGLRSASLPVKVASATIQPMKMWPDKSTSTKLTRSCQPWLHLSAWTGDLYCTTPHTQKVFHLISWCMWAPCTGIQSETKTWKWFLSLCELIGSDCSSGNCSICLLRLHPHPPESSTCCSQAPSSSQKNRFQSLTSFPGKESNYMSGGLNKQK